MLSFSDSIGFIVNAYVLQKTEHFYLMINNELSLPNFPDSYFGNNQLFL